MELPGLHSSDLDSMSLARAAVQLSPAPKALQFWHDIPLFSSIECVRFLLEKQAVTVIRGPSCALVKAWISLVCSELLDDFETIQFKH